MCRELRCISILGVSEYRNIESCWFSCCTPAPSVHAAPLPLPEGRSQLVLEDLARRVARDRLDEVHGSRGLVARQMPPAECDGLLDSDVRPLAPDHDRLRRLA